MHRGVKCGCEGYVYKDVRVGVHGCEMYVGVKYGCEGVWV